MASDVPVERDVEPSIDNMVSDRRSDYIEIDEVDEHAPDTTRTNDMNSTIFDYCFDIALYDVNVND